MRLIGDKQMTVGEMRGMPLHDQCKFTLDNVALVVTRVPNGWIYTVVSECISTFVPLY